MGASVRQQLTIDEFRQAFEGDLLDFANSEDFSVAAAELVADAPDDPCTPAYRDHVLAGWSRLTGRQSYRAMVDEAFDIDAGVHLRQPFPYSTADPMEVGRYLGAIAGLLRRLDVAPPAKVAELGAGWGLLSMHLAQVGYDVTAVDLNADSVSLLSERARRNEIALRVVRSSFLDFTPDSELDAIVFFESFHHCEDPMMLLDRCVDWLAPTGRLAFVAEAIYDGFHVPWGLRLDGSATFAARAFGWLELGFDRAFFYRQLLARGLAVEESRDETLGPYGTYVIARPWADAVEPGRTRLPADEERTWIRADLPGLLATDRSTITLPRSMAQAFEATLVNLCDEPLHVGADGVGEPLLLEPGERCAVRSRTAAADASSWRISSGHAACPAIGGRPAGVYLESIRAVH